MKGDEIVTSTASKPWLSGNMLLNIKTFKNGWSNFSENLRIVRLKVVEIKVFLSPKSRNLQLFTLILYGVGVRCDVDIFKLTASAQSIYRNVYVYR